ncbi:hypothetical protein [Labrys sp. 22185]|uniref:hypothetical protein n=1 Tax=Labrys sp. 22185 TaxID=3453888 RepID=UPI003F82E880
MTFLAENDIPFILRIKDAFQIRLADGRRCPVASLFRKLAIEGAAMYAILAASGCAAVRSGCGFRRSRTPIPI